MTTNENTAPARWIAHTHLVRGNANTTVCGWNLDVHNVSISIFSADVTCIACRHLITDNDR